MIGGPAEVAIPVYVGDSILRTIPADVDEGERLAHWDAVPFISARATLPLSSALV
jgi:hypothetical protein